MDCMQHLRYLCILIYTCICFCGKKVKKGILWKMYSSIRTCWLFSLWYIPSTGCKQWISPVTICLMRLLDNVRYLPDKYGICLLPSLSTFAVYRLSLWRGIENSRMAFFSYHQHKCWRRANTGRRVWGLSTETRCENSIRKVATL